MNEGLGTKKSARANRNLELSDLELSVVNLVTLWRKIFGTDRKTRVIRKFELSESELTSFNCIGETEILTDDMPIHQAFAIFLKIYTLIAPFKWMLERLNIENPGFTVFRETGIPIWQKNL